MDVYPARNGLNLPTAGDPTGLIKGWQPKAA